MISKSNRGRNGALVALMAACLLASGDARALALGRVTVQSALGDPLRAEIELADINSAEAATIQPAIALPDAFKAAGFDYNAALAGAQLSLQRHPDGRAYDTLEYSADEIERVARTAFELARTRRRKLLSVDKANVLETSRLWREVVSELGQEYPDVALSHMYVDNCALQIVLDATQFDVMLTENMMGDILSDEVAGFCGGLGLAASASIGVAGTPGIFEPVHGSAPDIAGKGLANPAAMLLTTSLLLAYGLGEHEWAAKLDAAVAHALTVVQTPDQGGSASTADVGDAVLAALGL